MKRYVFFILAFQVVSGNAVAGQMPKSNSEKSSSTGIRVTRPSHPTVSKSRETLSAHGSHSATSRTKIPKSSGAPTRSHKMPPSNTTGQRSSEKVPTGRPAPRASPKSSVSSTTRTISDQRPKPSFPGGTFPTSTKAPNSSRLDALRLLIFLATSL